MPQVRTSVPRHTNKKTDTYSNLGIENPKGYSWLNSFSPNSEAHRLDASTLQLVQDFVDNDKIPEQRRNAVMSQITGLLGNLQEQSVFDAMSEAIIGTSNYQKAMNNASTQIGTLIGQMENTDWQTEYDSAQSQTEQILDAGVNPNLSNVSAGSASDFDDQSSALTPPSGNQIDPLSSVSSVAGTIMQVISGVMSFASGAMSMVEKGVDIAGKETSNALAESDMIKDAVNRSGIYPSSALDLTGSVFVDAAGKEHLMNFRDKQGNMLPYEKLNKEQKALITELATYHDTQNDDLFNMMFSHYGFSRKKMFRLKNKFYNYLKSPEYYRTYYENMTGFRKAQQEKQGIENSPLFSAFDSLLNSVQKAYQNADVFATQNENIYNSQKYKALIEKGIPKDEAAQMARQFLRDESDNKVLDELRQLNSDVLDDVERDSKGNKVKTKKYSQWDKFMARACLVLLYLVRSGNFKLH